MIINEEAVAVVQNGAVPMDRAQAVQIVHYLQVDGLLMPDLPAPDNDYPEWRVGGVSISPGPDAGEVAIEWEDREDTGRGTVTRSLYLAPDQVCALLAAAMPISTLADKTAHRYTPGDN